MAQVAQDSPKLAQKGSLDSPKMKQVGPRLLQNCSNKATKATKMMAQKCPKMFPRWPRHDTRWSKMYVSGCLVGLFILGNLLRSPSFCLPSAFVLPSLRSAFALLCLVLPLFCFAFVLLSLCLCCAFVFPWLAEWGGSQKLLMFVTENKATTRPRNAAS